MLAIPTLFQSMTIATPRNVAFSASGLLYTLLGGNRSLAQGNIFLILKYSACGPES
jgi:hypothetical protein